MKIAHRKQIILRDHAVWDTFVDLASGAGGFCHSELVFSNGESFSSTTKFDPDTLVHPDAIERNRHPEFQNGPILRRMHRPAWEWEFTELPVTDSQELQVYQWCLETINEALKEKAGYDWAGVLRFVFKWMKEAPKNYFCSEAVVAACQQAGFFPGVKAWTVSPNRLREMCWEEIE